MNKPGIVNIRGKEYQTVALRVHGFREAFPSYSLVTEILHRDLDCVVMRATIADETGRVIATGHAEEYRKASEINKTSALENAETSAIGRALAALGIGGTEFASADEVQHAIDGKMPAPSDPWSVFKPAESARIRMVGQACIDYFNAGKEWGAWEEYSTLLDKAKDNDFRNNVILALWDMWKPHSALRAYIKKAEADLKNAEPTNTN